MGRSVQSLERGLLVMEALVNNGPKGVTELAKELDLDKTIVHRLLSTLQAMGYAQQDENRKYTTGMQLRRIGAKLLSGLDVRVLAGPYAQELIDLTKGVAHLAKMVDGRAVYLEKVQHPALGIKATDVGGEAPGYCSAAGKVLWAHLPPENLNEVLTHAQFRQHTQNTITDVQSLQQHLAEVREYGYAVDREEHRLGLIGVGAPVFDHTGSVIASICVAASAFSEDEDIIDETRHKVIDVAQRLSADLGYSSGDNA
jgi:DNA-binding IclR family transcriptional regulator